MSELQDHIDFVEGERNAAAWHLQGEEVATVMEAARLVANASTVALHRFDGGMWELHAVDGLEGEPEATHLLIALTPGDPK